MKKNLSTTDRLIRVILAVVFGYLYFSGTVAGTAGIILLLAGIILALTAFVSFCPLYALLGFKTYHAQQKR